jgi:hypothetical protein
MTTNNSYDPTFVQSTGFGQSPSNPAPSLFVDSIALTKDLSVYGSMFSTNNLLVGGSAAISGGLTASAAAFGGTKFGASSASIGVPVTINADTTVKGYLKTTNLEVQEIEFRAIQLPGLDNYYVLASYIPPSDGNT